MSESCERERERERVVRERERVLLTDSQICFNS